MNAAAATPEYHTVSVVIPVKDDGIELRRCLRALARQTRQPDEVIVVDNGSSDASADIARQADARVIRCDEPGIPAASALGYDSAAGELILRLDADCVPGDRWIETVVKAFIRRPDVGAFTGGAHFIDGPRALRGPLGAIYLGMYAIVGMVSLGHLPVFGSNLAMRRRVWRGIRSQVHRHDPDLHDDFDLAFHLGELVPIRFLPGAEMGVSMRPFAGLRGFARRTRWGFRTVLVHWPREFPPVRWTRVLLRAQLLPWFEKRQLEKRRVEIAR